MQQCSQLGGAGVNTFESLAGKGAQFFGCGPAAAEGLDDFEQSGPFLPDGDCVQGDDAKLVGLVDFVGATHGAEEVVVKSGGQGDIVDHFKPGIIQGVDGALLG